MSQSGPLSVRGASGGTVDTLTPNSGGTVGPDGSGNINVLGNMTSGITTIGSPGTNTITIIASTATTTQLGTIQLATNAQAIAGTDASNAVTSAALTAKLGTQTAHSVAIFEGTNAALKALGVATNGQLVIGSTGADPVLSNITSSGGTVTITNGPGTINLELSGSPGSLTLTGNSGGALSPSGGNFNILGAGSITTSGSGSTLTVGLTGLTNHNVLVGAGTTTITSVVPSATAGVPLVSTGSTSDPAFGTAVVAGGGTGDTSFTVYAPICGGTTTTGILQSASTGISNTGFVLTSTGVSSLPTWQAGGGGSGGITTIDGDTGSMTPTGGTVTISGGTTGLTTAAATSTMDLTGTLVLANGGTSASLTASNGGIFYSTASAGAILSGTATADQILLSGSSAAPSWSTATYPVTVTANEILYASASNVIGQITTSNNGVLITGTSGIPSLLANSATPGFVLTANSGAPPSWQAGGTSGAVTTIDGDSGSMTPTAGVVTISGGTTGLTTTASASTMDLTGTLHLANGGTNASLTASNGGIFYSTASAGAILAGTATANQVLLSGSSTTPAWSTATYPATTTVSQLLYSSSSNVITGLSTANNGVLITSSSGVPSLLAAGTTGQVLTATTGSPPSWSTITTGVSSVTGTANQILASPTTGAVVLSLIGPYTPATYTAHGVLVGEGTSSIVAVSPSTTSGVPLISQGSSADPAYGTAVVAGGGTGNTTFTAYSVICAGTTATGAFQNVSGVGTSGQVLTSNGASALPTWQPAGGGSSLLTITSVSFGASPYTVLTADQFLAVQTSGGAISILLPNAPTTGRVIYIKDSNGAAATSNISITTVGGTVTIDGQTTYKIQANYGSINVVFDGTNYEVF